MRTLDELGISSAPWRVSRPWSHWIEFADYNESDEYGKYESFAVPDDEHSIANARLIASAPTMYKTLFDEYNFLNAIYEEMPNGQIERRMLAIADALAEASGESANSIACQHNGAFACSDCAFRWLDLEAKAEEPLPCPFCGSETIKITCVTTHCYGYAYCGKCGYRTMECHNRDAAIAAHNRVARAAKGKEANDANA